MKWLFENVCIVVWSLLPKTELKCACQSPFWCHSSPFATPLSCPARVVRTLWPPLAGPACPWLDFAATEGETYYFAGEKVSKVCSHQGRVLSLKKNGCAASAVLRVQWNLEKQVFRSINTGVSTPRVRLQVCPNHDTCLGIKGLSLIIQLS